MLELKPATNCEKSGSFSRPFSSGGLNKLPDSWLVHVLSGKTGIPLWRITTKPLLLTVNCKQVKIKTKNQQEIIL